MLINSLFHYYDKDSRYAALFSRQIHQIFVEIQRWRGRFIMFQATTYSGKKVDDYTLVLKQLQALSEDEKDEIAILSNASALLNQFLSEVNWVGFYVRSEERRVGKGCIS